MTIKRYSSNESFDRIFRVLTGNTPTTDAEGTLTGELPAWDESLSYIAELLQNSMDGYRFIIPPSLTSSVQSITTATYTIQMTGLSGTYHVTRTTTGACTITLNSDLIAVGRELTIKDAGINADTYNITIQTEGAETIDGSATLVMNLPGMSVTLYSDGNNWFIK